MRDSTENKITMAFIRHGETASNRRKSYLGWTDEPLSEDGCEMLLRNRKNYPAADLIFTSPMLRCRQTKEILYKDQPYQIIEKWKEMNFGSFEGKTYFDLNGNEDYQRWIDSGGTLPFPGGEALTDFKKRSVRAFLETVSKSESILKGQVTSGKQDDTTVAYVVHGGTIMAVLSELYGGDYYDYHCGNGEGYLCSLTKDKKLSVIGKISARNGCEIHGTVLE